MKIKGTTKNHFISKRLASQKRVTISIANRNKVNTDRIKSNSIQKVI